MTSRALVTGGAGCIGSHVAEPAWRPATGPLSLGNRVLGWAPRVSLADGLADTFRWFAARTASAIPSRL